MQPGGAKRAGQLFFGGTASYDAALDGAGTNPYRSGDIQPKSAEASVSSSAQAGLAACRPAQASNNNTTTTTTGRGGLAAGLELPSVDALKLLLARYPGLGPALQNLDWDEHGRVSKPTLLRIISALGADQLLEPQHTPTAKAQSAAVTAQDEQHLQDAAGAANTSSAAPAQAAAEQRVHAAAASAAAPASALEGFAAAWSRLSADAGDATTGSTRAAAGEGGTTTASTPSLACGGMSAGALGSSAGSPRRTSLRPTLSIDISSLRVSDSSDSTEDGDSSSMHEPPAPAPAVHAAGNSNAGNAATTGAKAAAGNNHAAAFEHTPAPAGEVHSSSGSHADPVLASSNVGGKKKHCSTPGIALHATNRFHDDEPHGSSDEDADLDAAAAAHHSTACAGVHVAAGSLPKHAQQQHPRSGSSKSGRKAQTPATGLGKPVSIFSGSGGSLESGIVDEEQSAQHSTVSKVSPLSNTSTRQHAGHAVGFSQHPAFGGHAGNRGASAHSKQQQHMQDRLQYAGKSAGNSSSNSCHWDHKLSKRPPTPGAALGKPISIFSGSGGHDAGHAHAHAHVSESGSESDVSSLAGADSAPADGDSTSGSRLVTFADVHGYDIELAAGAGSRPHSPATAAAPGTAAGDIPQQKHAGPQQHTGRHQEQPEQQQDTHVHCQWHHKLSKRPPTPGVSLAQPVSIFSSSASSHAAASSAHQEEQHGHVAHMQDDEEDWGHVKFAQAAGDTRNSRGGSKIPVSHSTDHKQRAAFPEDVDDFGHVKVASDLGRSASRSGSSKIPLSPREAGPAAGRRQPQASAAGSVAADAAQHAEQGQQHWHHKLSQRPPTPGVSLGKPVSIFSADGGGSNSRGAAAQQLRSAEDLEGTCSEDEGHVHFAAPKAAASSQHCSSKTSSKAPKSVIREEREDDADDDSHVHFTAAGTNTNSRIPHGPAADPQEEQQQQHWNHKLSKRPPTPGVSLGQPLSIFSGSSSTAAGPSTSSGAEPKHKHAQIGSSHRVSWEDEDAAHCALQHHDSLHEQLHQLQQTTAAAAAAAAAAVTTDNCSNGGSNRRGSGAGFEKRRITWGDEGEPVSCGANAQPGSTAAAAAVSAKAEGGVHIMSHRVTWEDEGTESALGSGSTGGSVSGGPQHRSKGVQFRHTGSECDSDREESCAAHASSTHPELSPAVAADLQQQQQHGKTKLRARAPTPGLTLGHHPDSIFSQAEDSDDADPEEQQQPAAAVGSAHAAAQPAAAESGADEAAAIGATASSAKPSLVARLNPDIAAEAQQQKWQQHLTNRRPTPGASLQQHHSIFAAAFEEASAKSRSRSATATAAAAAGDMADGGKLSRIPSAPLASSISNGSSRIDSTIGEVAEGAALAATVAEPVSAAKQVLLKQHPELAAEAREQKWQRHMAARPPTPGASLGRNNIFADEDEDRGPAAAEQRPAKAASNAAPAGSAGSSGSTGTPSAGADLPGSILRSASSNGSKIPSGPTAEAGSVSSRRSAKQALLKLHPQLAAEAAEQKWQQHMANRPPTPGASLLQHNMFADGDDAPECAARVEPAASNTTAISSGASSRIPGGPAAGQQALLKLRPELAAEAAEQKWQQHMANRPPTPGASLLQHNMFADEDDTTEPAAAGAAPAAANGSSSSSSSRIPGGPAAGKQALLKLRPELAAEAAEQKWQQHMANRPPTPGACLLQHNIFTDERDTPEPAAAAAPAASSSSSSSTIPIGPAAGKQALLKLRPELAAEAAEQKWQQHMANRPPTPGASLLHQPNIFADNADDDAAAEDEQAHYSAFATGVTPSRAAAAAGGGGGSNTVRASSRGSSMAKGSQSRIPASPSGHGGAASALVLHNPDLAPEQQSQWEQKLSRRPPTPAATLGKPFNMFADDEHEQGSEQQQPVLRLPSGNSSSGAGGVPVAPVGAAALRSRSPDQARSASNSSGTDSATSSPSRGASPGTSNSIAAAAAGGPGSTTTTSSSSSSSRAGSSNPGRQRGSSPLRNITTAADVAEQEDRATRSPLRHSSSLCDPDPARMSPLGRRISATGSPGTSTPTSPTVKPVQAPAAGAAAPSRASTISSTPVAKVEAAPREAAAAVAPAAAGADAHESKVARPNQTAGGRSESHSPSRLARSASPSVDAREGGRSSLAQRSGSPLSRSSSSAEQSAAGVRHGSPLSRCSSGGYC